MAERTTVAVGFSIGHTYMFGRAKVAVVRGPAAVPHVVDSWSLGLCDPMLPQSRQPYHDDAGAVRANGPELSRLIASVEQFGRRSVIDIIDRYDHNGYRLEGIAVTVGTLQDPETLQNERMRGYALEQRLFGRVIEEACARRCVPCVVLSEKTLLDLALRVCCRLPELRSLWAVGNLRSLGSGAAFAAWLVLADDLSLRELIRAIRSIRR